MEMNPDWEELKNIELLKCKILFVFSGEAWIILLRGIYFLMFWRHHFTWMLAFLSHCEVRMMDEFIYLNDYILF